MASQTQTAATQTKSPSGLALMIVAVAGVLIVIAIAWAMFSAGSAPSVAAPSRTTIQTLQEPGLLDQKRGERGGAVATNAPVYNPFDPALQPQVKPAPGNPYVNIHPPVRKPAQTKVITDGLVEHRRGERGMELPNGTYWTPSLSEHRRGELRGD